jgi:hypothetical protein
MVTTCDTVIVAYYNGDKIYYYGCMPRVFHYGGHLSPRNRICRVNRLNTYLHHTYYILLWSYNPLPVVSSYACTPFV